MKKLLLGLMMLFAFNAFTQSTHTVDFEPAGVGAGWDWTVAENADNPPLEFIANPVSGGINTTATVAKFTARLTGNPWALCFTDDDGEFTFDATNATVTIMVYKPVISNIGMKFEGSSPAVEIQIPNTVTNQWEEITFDFSASIGNTYSRLVIIPDFDMAGRTQENIIYFDNIQVPDGVITGPLPEPTTVPPIPPHAAVDVISIYSDTYTNIPGTDFNPNWGQSTTVTVDYLAAGNNTLKYENLNYQGTQFASALDVSGYENLHVDFWTPNSTDLGIFLISSGPVEVEYLLVPPGTTESWQSLDIPLTAFAGVNLADVIQFKVDGNGTVYFDNWYFWKTPGGAGTDATLSDLQVDGTTVAGFLPTTLSYDVELPYGTTIVPTVTATPNDPLASHVVNPAASLPGTTEVVVTAENGINTLTYNVNFTVAGPEPTTVPPIPPHAAADVISIYSDTYTTISGVDYNPNWGQTTIVTVDYIAAGNNTLRYENLNYQGTDWNGNPQNVSGHEYLHVDFWTSNSTDLGIYLVSNVWPNNVEFEYVFTIQTEQWVSVDIPLTYFSGGGVDLADARQFKVEGNGDIWFDNLYFWKSPGGGTLTFNPEDGSTNVPITVNPTLTFSVPVEMANGSAITNGDIPSIITFKETDAGGTNVPFTGTIDAEKKVISVNPDSDLSNSQVYYLAINNEVIRYQGGDLIAGESIVFTTIHAIQLDLYDNFDDASTLTWGYWDNFAGGILDVEADNPSVFSPVNTTPIVAKYTKEEGSDAYTHAFAILGGKLDLSVNNQFQMYVYSENAGSIFAAKLQNNDLPAPWTTEVTVEYTIQSTNAWEVVIFDFSPYSDRTDLDKFLLMINPGLTGAGVHYFDELYGPPFTPPAPSPVVVNAYTTDDGSAIEVQFDKDMEPEPGNNGNFNVYVDGLINPVTSTYRKTEDHTIIVLNLTTPVEPGNAILLSYLMSGTVTSLDNGILQPFENYSVTNTLIIQLDLTVFLEGPFNVFNMNTTLNPSYLPLNQPYNSSPWNYNGTESVGSIPNTDVVDWLLIELRDAPNAALATSGTMIARQAAFLLRNGDVVDLDGASDLLFDVNISDSLFVVIWHRNHLWVMSSYGLVRTGGVYSYNFTTGSDQAFNGNLKEIGLSVWGMFGGNGLADDQIGDLDKTSVWELEAGNEGYYQGDFNMDSQVDNVDKNEVWLLNNGTFADEYQLIWQDEFDADGAPEAEN